MVLFTTGAYIAPRKLHHDDGTQGWVWVVVAFDGDTFADDGREFNAREEALTKHELITEQE